jgi:hypothetical protein
MNSVPSSDAKCSANLSGHGHRMDLTRVQKLDNPCGWIYSVTEYVQPLVYGHVEPDETCCKEVCYHFIVIMVKER